MDLKANKYFEAPPMFASQQEAAAMGANTVFCKTSTENPLLDAFHDPLCKLNLKETSEFVKSFPMARNGSEKGVFLDVSAQRREALTKKNVEAPPTPGRPIFSFSVGSLPQKTFPSKWDDAEKWLISGSSCHGSPAHHHCSKLTEYSKTSKQCSVFKPQQAELVAEKSRVIDKKASKVVSGSQGLLPLDHHYSAGAFREGPTSVDVFLKDKLTSEAEQSYPTFKCSEPMKEGFLFANATEKSMEDAAKEVKHRDIGTEMTPLGSSTTSRCHTPFKSTSPARHNTPANRSGPLALPNSSTMPVNITQLQECHLAKLQFATQFDSVTSNWSSREEEEEDISKSLRHFEINNECRRSVSESRTCAWEEEEKTKCCLRYQREEANIQAWVNLQSAKAEAQSRKLEVKIQKMRSNLEEKLMKRMAIVHRKAEEWRTAARLQHSEQIQKASEQGRKMMSRQNSYLASKNSCGCFPCNDHHI